MLLRSLISAALLTYTVFVSEQVVVDADEFMKGYKHTDSLRFFGMEL